MGGSNGATGTDTCSFDSVIPPFTSVTGSAWLIGGSTPGYPESQVVAAGHNQWGPDIIGYSMTAVRYYQLNRPKLGLGLPCGFTLHQNLEIQCTQDGTRTVYKADNPIKATVDQTGVQNCRSGVCTPHVTYP